MLVRAAAGVGLLALLSLPVAAQSHKPKAAGAKSHKPAAKALQTPVSTGPLKAFTQTLPGSVVKVDMMPIPAGSIKIAAPNGASAVYPVKPFWMASTETTWEMYDAFTSSGPPTVAYDQTVYTADAVARPSKSYIPPDLGWGHHGYPAINISILSARMFCRWLASKTGKKFRLPTEAEWEWAARAGKTGPWKSTPATLAAIAWTAENSDKKQTQPVGKKKPNAWGLFDVLGNVGEWSIDMNDKPVLCGGSWQDKAAAVKPETRAYQTPDWQVTDPQIPKSRWWLSDGRFVGFRIVCEP